MANIGLYALGQSAVYYVLAAPLVNTRSGPEETLSNTTVEEDITPTFVQATEGQAGATETQPTAEVVWRTFDGAIGLYKQSQAPGDLTRCFISDADTTRANQITAWLRWSSSSDTVAVDAVSGTILPHQITGLVNDPLAPGFTATAWDVNQIPNYGYWRWNGTKFAYQRATQAAAASGAGGNRLPVIIGTPVGPSYPYQMIAGTGTNLWMAIGGAGCTDISVAPAAGVGVANAVGAFVYFDILFVVALTGGNLTITPYRPNTPGSGNILQSVTYAGLANCLGTIPGEVAFLGAVACEGAVYIVTDRAVHAMQWNDNNNTILTSRLFELPRFTSAPVVWNGEVYIGADNRIAHITPGQRGFDWRMVDQFGVLPTPFSSTIVQLIPSADALYAIIQSLPGNSGRVILRMDANGAWSCPYYSATDAIQPIVPVVDGTNPFTLAIVAGATATMLPLPAAGRNPRTLATSARAQRAGPVRTITPWYDLASETSQKILERIRAQCLSMAGSPSIRILYQTDFADEVNTDTFSTGCAKGTGTWHVCAVLFAGMVTGSDCFAGGVDANGNGVAWMEFDNATNYTTVGLLPAYPTYKQVRFCIELTGDTSGTTVPTHLSLGFHRLEFITKGYEREVQLRIRVGEEHGTGQQPASTVRYADSAAVVTAKNALRALVSAKTPCTLVEETNTASPVIITKYRANLLGVDGNGQPNEYAITLTLQYIQLVGLN